MARSMPSPIVPLVSASPYNLPTTRKQSYKSLLSFLAHVAPSVPCSEGDKGTQTDCVSPATSEGNATALWPSKRPKLIEFLIDNGKYRLIKVRAPKRHGKYKGQLGSRLQIGVHTDDGLLWYEAGLYKQHTTSGTYWLVYVSNLDKVPGLREFLTPTGIFESITESTTGTILLSRLVLALQEGYIWWCNRLKLREAGLDENAIEWLFLLGTEAHHADSDTTNNVRSNVVGLPVLLHRLEHGLQRLPSIYRLMAMQGILRSIITEWGHLRMASLYEFAKGLTYSDTEEGGFVGEQEKEPMCADAISDNENDKNALTDRDGISVQHQVTTQPPHRFKGAAMRISGVQYPRCEMMVLALQKRGAGRYRGPPRQRVA